MKYCPHCNSQLTRAGKDEKGRPVWECLNVFGCKDGNEIDFIEENNKLLIRSAIMDDFGEVSFQIK